jgi:hypothetical protein
VGIGLQDSLPEAGVTPTLADQRYSLLLCRQLQVAKSGGGSDWLGQRVGEVAADQVFNPGRQRPRVGRQKILNLGVEAARDVGAPKPARLVVQLTFPAQLPKIRFAVPEVGERHRRSTRRPGGRTELVDERRHRASACS